MSQIQMHKKGCFVFLFFIIFITSVAQKKSRYNDSIISYAKAIINEGDVIFRNGNSKESTLIKSFSAGDGSFSHCGIVLKDFYDNIKVYHMLGGHRINNTDLQEDGFEDFVSDSANNSFAVFRYKLTTSECKKIKKYIDKLKKEEVKFDYQFSCLSKDSLYCTEMIVRCLKYATNGKIRFELFTLDISKNPVRYFLKRDSLIYYPLEFLQNNRFIIQSYIFRFR
jgi:permuted papain-like amidase YaeF/Yiix C92 family enzyme